MPEKTTGNTLRKSFLRKMNRRVASIYQQASAMSEKILILTTRGRKSGLPRHTPLQYEWVDGCYVVAAGWGKTSDWYLNAVADPRVKIQVGPQHFDATAEAVEDAERIADFLALRLKRHPLMIGVLMRLDGLPLFYSREDLLRFSAQKVMLVIHPEVKT